MCMHVMHRHGRRWVQLGRCDGRSMWGIIGALTLMSPLLILTLQVEALQLQLIHLIRDHPC